MAGFAKVRVSPVKRFWRGQPKTRPFQLFVTPEGGTPITVDGTLLQESVLPSWFLKALLALIVLLIALVLIWLLLLKPTIQIRGHRRRRVAAREPQGGRQRRARRGRPADDRRPRPAQRWRRRRSPRRRAPSGERVAASGGGGASPAPSGTPAVVIPGLGNPVDGRPRHGATRSSPPTGTLFITDFVFSNPNGAEGTLTVSRNDHAAPVRCSWRTSATTTCTS